MIRFREGKPIAIWYSQHANGQAFEYDTVHKYEGGIRVSEVQAKLLLILTSHSPLPIVPTALTQSTPLRAHMRTASLT